MHLLAAYPCLKLYAYNIRRRLDVLSVLSGLDGGQQSVD
jgi:hypothetical protein